MKLTRRKINHLHKALTALDTLKGADLKFSPKVRYALAKNLRLLSTRTEDFEKARVGFVKQTGVAANPNENSPELIKFDQEWTAFLDGEEEVPNIMRFTEAELNLDVNPIPISVLAILMDLVIENDVEQK